MCNNGGIDPGDSCVDERAAVTPLLSGIVFLIIVVPVAIVKIRQFDETGFGHSYNIHGW